MNQWFIREKYSCAIFRVITKKLHYVTNLGFGSNLGFACAILMANFESCHDRVAMNFHLKFFQVQARSFFQILNGFLVGFTLGGGA